MTHPTLFCLVAAMLVGGSVYAASPPASAVGYSGSGVLKPAPARSSRYAIDAHLSSGSAAIDAKQPDRAAAAIYAPQLPPRFALTAALHAKGAAISAAAPCAVNDLFKTGFE